MKRSGKYIQDFEGIDTKPMKDPASRNNKSVIRDGLPIYLGDTKACPRLDQVCESHQSHASGCIHDS